MMALNDRKQCINTNTPSFEQFTTLWFSEKEIEWRDTYKRKIQDIIDIYLLPEFGTRPIHLIKKTDVLAFRSSLAKVTIMNVKLQPSMT